MGDPSDNIFGFDGKKRSKVPKFMEPMVSMLMEQETPKDMDDYVTGLYIEHDQQQYYHINAACLWIQRKVNDNWQDHVNVKTQHSNQD